eukprot:3403329-Pleurochrysis_carterae.AAC.1
MPLKRAWEAFSRTALLSCNSCDLLLEYAADMAAAGSADNIASPTWFGHVFRVAPELAHIVIASGKENFGRCTKCGDLEFALREARKRGDAQL